MFRRAVSFPLIYFSSIILLHNMYEVPTIKQCICVYNNMSDFVFNNTHISWWNWRWNMRNTFPCIIYLLIQCKVYVREHKNCRNFIANECENQPIYSVLYVNIVKSEFLWRIKISIQIVICSAKKGDNFVCVVRCQNRLVIFVVTIWPNFLFLT